MKAWLKGGLLAIGIGCLSTVGAFVTKSLIWFLLTLLPGWWPLSKISDCFSLDFEDALSGYFCSGVLSNPLTVKITIYAANILVYFLAGACIGWLLKKKRTYGIAAKNAIQ